MIGFEKVLTTIVRVSYRIFLGGRGENKDLHDSSKRSNRCNCNNLCMQ